MKNLAQIGKRLAAGRGLLLTLLLLGLSAGLTGGAVLSATSQAPHPKAPAPRGPLALFDASRMGSPLQLDQNWRVGISADARAAQPDFDDSGWAVRTATSTLADVAGPEDEQKSSPNDEPKQIRKQVQEEVQEDLQNAGKQPGKQLHRLPLPHPHRLLIDQQQYAWFRLHIRLAPNHGPVALMIELPVSQNTSVFFNTPGVGADVFANGRLIQPEGPHGDQPQHYQQISRIYNLQMDAQTTDLVLAVRTLYIPFGLSSYTSFFARRTLLLGSPDELNQRLQLWSTANLLERVPLLVYSVLLVVLALFLLGLHFGQRGHREYLWLALHELVQAPIAYIELAGSTARLDSLWYFATVLQLVLLSAYLYFEFLTAFLVLRRRWYVRGLRWTAPVLLLVGPSLLAVGHSKMIWLALILTLGMSSLWIFGWLLFVTIPLLRAAARRHFEACLLLIPLVLSLIGLFEPVMTTAMTEWTGTAYRSPLTLQAGPVPIKFASIADFTGILVIVLIIFFRFQRIQREQERASSELAAARSVQELMIPAEKIATPGFEVDSIYEPANEVGGDFFFVRPLADGGLLVVIGDVAGKGLQAAMNVSMLMGALRAADTHRPATILDELNRVLVGSQSFTTCQAVHFAADGSVTLASAGHLPPYLNSQEVETPGGLPLGSLSGVQYEEIRLFLHPGDRLLMLSDGVTEARRTSGELFGFDRVRNLSNQSAFYIAEAARVFGQEDDITVLTVRRTEALATAPAASHS